MFSPFEAFCRKRKSDDQFERKSKTCFEILFTRTPSYQSNLSVCFFYKRTLEVELHISHGEKNYEETKQRIYFSYQKIQSFHTSTGFLCKDPVLSTPGSGPWTFVPGRSEFFFFFMGHLIGGFSFFLGEGAGGICYTYFCF